MDSFRCFVEFAYWMLFAMDVVFILTFIGAATLLAVFVWKRVRNARKT
jgi:hypothetical protein